MLKDEHSTGNILDAVWVIFARDGHIKYFGVNHNTKDDFKDSLKEMLADKNRKLTLIKKNHN